MLKVITLAWPLKVVVWENLECNHFYPLLSRSQTRWFHFTFARSCAQKSLNRNTLRWCRPSAPWCLDSGLMFKSSSCPLKRWEAVSNVLAGNQMYRSYNGDIVQWGRVLFGSFASNVTGLGWLFSIEPFSNHFQLKGVISWEESLTFARHNRANAFSTVSTWCEAGRKSWSTNW